MEEIKFGKEVMNQLSGRPVTYDQVSRSLGLAPKQIQKALADLCKYHYVAKLDKGYVLGQEVQNG